MIDEDFINTSEQLWLKVPIGHEISAFDLGARYDPVNLAFYTVREDMDLWPELLGTYPRCNTYAETGRGDGSCPAGYALETTVPPLPGVAYSAEQAPEPLLPPAGEVAEWPGLTIPENKILGNVCFGAQIDPADRTQFMAPETTAAPSPPPAEMPADSSHGASDPFIPHPNAERVFAVLDRLYENASKPGLRSRTEGALLVAPAGHGKTTIMKHYWTNGGCALGSCSGVAYTVAPPSAGEHGFYDRTLDSMGAKFSTRTTLRGKQEQFSNLCRERGIRMLIVDEMANILVGTTPKARANLLYLMRDFSNTLNLSVVLVGTEKLRVMINSDSQLSSRFPAIEMPLYAVGESYVNFIAQCLLQRGFEITSLDSEFVNLVHLRSSGNIGATIMIVRTLADCAESMGTTIIDSKILKEAIKLAQKPDYFQTLNLDPQFVSLARDNRWQR